MRSSTLKMRAVCLALCASLPLTVRAQPAISEQEAREIGVEGYVFLYPLITMEVTRRVATHVPPGLREGAGPMNAFHHLRTYPTAEFRAVVRPNFDTLYSSAWLDLTREPMIVSAPDTGGRYYLLPVMDMWTDVLASPGKRTSGTTAQTFAIVPQCWKGSLPKGVQRIESSTSYVWIIGRTQTNGPKDYEAVHKIQDGFSITPLSQWGRKAATVAKYAWDPNVDLTTPPMVQVNTMRAAQYFALGAELMKANPPHATDWSTIARLKRIGLEPGKPFDLAKAAPAVRAGLEPAPGDGLKLMKEKMPALARVVNGWQMNTDAIGVYGNFYLKRAIVAMAALGALPPEDAIYPISVGDADGKPLVGEGRYVFHFDKTKLPPAGAFWSITMYTAEGYPVANPINRFAIGDRDALQYNSDGSLDLYLQHASPGPDKESNWLPAPASGALGVTMRLYAPKAQALDGRWVPPPIKRLP